MTDTRTPAELQDAMEAARLDFEHWRRRRSRTVHDETPSQYDGCRTVEDDRLDDPRHGQADSINRGR